MHEWIMSIGQAILDYFRNFDATTLMQALEITVTGWLGIFVVMGVIILVVYLLNKIKS